MEKLISIRSKTIGFMYRKILRPLFFQFDPEFIHNFFISVGKILGSNIITRKITHSLFYYRNSMLKQRILGIEFENPLGLSAGFDKNAEMVPVMEDVGFGFSEVGSITAKGGVGNPGARMKRLVKEKSLWINLGLNNKGADETAERLKKNKYNIPVGISIAKTNCPETADDDIGIKDYVYSLKRFNDLRVGDFYVLNISCPNAYGGQPFSRKKAYEKLLKDVANLKVKKPIFVKLSPDLSKKNVDEILRISERYKVRGFIISNLSKKNSFGKGGLSGKPVEEVSNKMLKYVYSKTKGKYVLIGVGGVFSAEDAYKKIKLGANLVSLITGMIYQGPQLIGEINQGIVELLKMDGYKNISDAVGKDVT